MKNVKSERVSTYMIASDNRPTEHRTKRLKSRLREHIRKIHYQPLLSEPWLTMSDSISQVAEVAFMEMSLPLSHDCTSSSAGQIGRNRQGTLWDQDDDQLAMSILLQEGKINLCVCLLCEYYKAMSTKQLARDNIMIAVGNTNWSG